jgi:methylglyoxal synthase
MKKRSIGLIAHDNKKPELVDWARYNIEKLKRMELIGTGTTGGMVERELGLSVLKMKSGPLGGDQQIGARIVEGQLDLLIFFWDPLEPHSHDVDVKALLRIAVVYNVPIACNRASADLMISSPIFGSG